MSVVNFDIGSISTADIKEASSGRGFKTISFSLYISNIISENIDKQSERKASVLNRPNLTVLNFRFCAWRFCASLFFSL